MKTTVFTQIAVDTHLTKGIAKLHGSCEVEADRDVTAIHYYYRTSSRDAWHSPEVA